MDSFQYTFTIDPYSLGGYSFPTNTITFSCAAAYCAGLSNDVNTLYNVDNSSTHPDPFTGQFSPGDFENFTFVNLLTGPWNRFPVGISTDYSQNQYIAGFVFQDILPWGAGELEVVSETVVFLGQPVGVPEPATFGLMALGLVLARIHHRRHGWRHIPGSRTRCRSICRHVRRHLESAWGSRTPRET